MVIDALPLHRVPTDVGALLSASLEPLRHQAAAIDVTLRLTAEDDLPVLSIDGYKIAWAVTTLVGNALRYVRHGSHSMPGGSIDVRVLCNSGRGAVTIEVQDDGPGISTNQLRELFTSGPGKSGTALSLMMIRDVAAAHGGQAEVESCTDRLRSGTTVRLTLPVA
jgi:signal transduction histidine kinase